MKKFLLVVGVLGAGAWLSASRVRAQADPAPTVVPSPSPAAVPGATPTATEALAAATPALDFGDSKSSTLTTKAWGALDAKNYAAAVGYTDKCIELYKEQAVSMQKALTAPTSDKDQTFAQWALNDVGTSYFIKGKALDAEGKKPEAQEAYKFLVEKLPYAQCWDTQGWFWKPADAAKDLLQTTEFDALK